MKSQRTKKKPLPLHVSQYRINAERANVILRTNNRIALLTAAAEQNRIVLLAAAAQEERIVLLTAAAHQDRFRFWQRKKFGIGALTLFVFVCCCFF
jgi:hypothetical protein